jgi:hypothetical protein
MKQKNLFLISLAAILFCGCEDEATPPSISFDNEGVNGLFAGDAITVSGKVSGSSDLSTFWFHSKLNESGSLDEQTGGRLETEADGSFVIPLLLEKNSVGVKVIAEDAAGRTVKVYPVIIGEDALIIAFEGSAELETVDAGDELNIKGTVTSGTPITALSYTVVKGDLSEPPVNIALTGQTSSVFDITMSARTGMTAIRLNAENRGSMKTSNTFVIKHVGASGPAVVFDAEKIEVKPDSVFKVSGTVVSDRAINALTYTVFRETGADAPQTAILGADSKFAVNIVANGKITAIVVTATDVNNKQGEETIPVKILFPERIDGNVMLHYKYLIFTDSRTFEKSYFSFDVAPYMMNKAQAFNNQAKIDLMYTNVFIAVGNANNGAALFGTNAYWATTILGTALTEGWTLSQNETSLARLPVQSDMTNMIGKTFDQLDDSEETWTAFDTYAKAKSSSNSVLRAGTATTTVNVGTIFLIKFGGNNVGGNNGITRNAVGIVRGKGGTPSTAAGMSTGAWLEIEIKVRK